MADNGESGMNYDNIFIRMLSRVGDAMLLSILFVLSCVPIITIGAAFTSLYYTAMKGISGDDGYIWKFYTRSFKQNFKQSTIINLIMLLIAGVLYFDTNIVRQMGGSMSKVLYIIFIALGIIYLAVFLYIYPVLAKFYNSVKNTFRNAFLMSIMHLPYTILMALITIAPVAIFFIPDFRVQSVIILLFILLGFALLAFINGHFLVKIFDNYIVPEKDEISEEDSEETPEDTSRNTPTV